MTHRYSLGDFELDTGKGELSRAGRTIPLQKKPFELLVALVAARGDLVSREELQRLLWPDTHIDVNLGLNTVVRKLRKALRDSTRSPRYVVTVPRQGYRLLAPIRSQPDRQERRPSPPLSRWEARRPGLLVATAAIAALALGSLWALSTGSHSGTSSSPGGQRLLILPFLDQGPQRDPAFRAGLLDELITAISGWVSIRVDVLPLSTSSRFDDPAVTAQSAAEVSKADLVLTGSLRIDGDRVHVSAQLTDFRQEKVAWSEVVQVDAANRLESQTAIASRLAELLARHMDLVALERRWRPPTGDSQAYEAWLQGRYLLYNPSELSSLDKSSRLLERAVSLDPNYAAAYATLARVHLSLLNRDRSEGSDDATSDRVDHAERARRAAFRAVELDPDLPSARLVAGFVYSMLDWNWRAAERNFRQALVLYPKWPDAQLSLAWLLTSQRRFHEALNLVEGVRERNPASPVSHLTHGWIAFRSGRPQQAAAVCLQVRDLYGPSREVDECLWRSYASTGDYDRALVFFGSDTTRRSRSMTDQVALRDEISAELDNAERSGTPEHTAFDLARSHAILGDSEAALRFLDEALKVRSPDATLLLATPEFEALWPTSRFRALASRMGLADVLKNADPSQPASSLPPDTHAGS